MRRLLGYQTVQAELVTTRVFAQVVEEGGFELRPVEFTMLQLVKENVGVTPTRLAAALAMTAPAVTIWLDRLEARGLIRRQRSASDRRTQIVTISDTGTELAVRAVRALLAAEREMLKHLTTGEQLILLELLHKVAAARAR